MKLYKVGHFTSHCPPAFLVPITIPPTFSLTENKKSTLTKTEDFQRCLNLEDNLFNIFLTSFKNNTVMVLELFIIYSIINLSIYKT